MVVQPPPDELNPPSTNPPSDNEISTDNAEQLVLLEKPENEKLYQLRTPRRASEIFLTSTKVAFVLIFAISYHTFCFIVHYRNVPIGGSGVLGLPFLHFNVVSVITTVAILIVYVALWPMKSLIDEIRAEEFFRLMHTHPNGLPLDSVNAVSATTTGAFDIFMATIHRHCSPLFSSTLVISLVITATSSIAPAALSAVSIEIDVDNSTFKAGALPPNSILFPKEQVDPLDPLSNVGRDIWQYASNMAWIENALNLTNSYYRVTSSEGDQFEYLVPCPPEYTSTMKAYWTTDVIVLEPSCSWQTATATATGDNSIWDVSLLESNLSISLANDSFVSYSNNMTNVSVSVCNNEGFVTVDGSILFVIDQLVVDPYSDPAAEILLPATITMDLSSIPTLNFSTGNILAFLMCSPHVSIQTRQVRATGNGNLTLGKTQQSQGNIDFYQANYALTYALSAFATNSGPTTSLGQVGTDLMEWFIFGGRPSLYDGVYSPNAGYPPAPLTNITAAYKQIIQSASKQMLSGTFGTQNVTGGYIVEQMAFTSSLGHVFTSATFFVFFTIALVAAQFRQRRVAFTFVNVAAALADSDVPQKCVEMTQFKMGTGERKVLKLVPSGDGQLNCTYQCIDQN